MQIEEFDFTLPPERIALRPVVPRDAARMLVVEGPGNSFLDSQVSKLGRWLRPGDILIANNTRVIPVQLSAIRSARAEGASARIGLTLHTRLGPAEWLSFARPGKKLVLGDTLTFSDGLDATITAKRPQGDIALRFTKSGPDLDMAIAAQGAMPLPPYIAERRPADAQDKQDYQTMFAISDGAIAAPTAGLHFTPDLIARLSDLGIGLEQVTLHVGPGTFLPVRCDDINDHRMHAEWGHVSASVAERLVRARARGGRLIAIGTTALRVLETAARDDGSIHPFAGETRIFITPGYRFKAVDGLLTNFHLPKSTLFMLVAAFCGLDTMKSAYAHAIQTGYRFYSYGDASLLFRG